jgi:N-acetylneuraminic acid mutarotase
MMTDLPGQPGILLLGGATRPGPPDIADMWAFTTDAGWREITPAALPRLAGHAPFTGNAFAFDSASGLGVFIDIKGNPWTYDSTANAWTDVPSGVGPTALLGAAMAYDSGSDRMIVFGGLDLATFRPNNETWAYDVDAATWERMQPAVSPTARNYVAMAYDVGSDRIILFGGAPASGVLGDTWAYDYDSDSWVEMTGPSSPAERAYSAMVYDPHGDRMILFGGSADQETAAFGDLWEYDFEANSWNEVVQTSHPAPRAWHAMAYDDESSSIVVFGGGTSRSSYSAETWLFDRATNSWDEWIP